MERAIPSKRIAGHVNWRVCYENGVWVIIESGDRQSSKPICLRDILMHLQCPAFKLVDCELPVHLIIVACLVKRDIAAQ
jgi:hypothetical protein